MSPSPEQIRQALANHRQPGRTRGARIRAAITHAKKSRAVNPAENIYSTKSGVTSADRQGMTDACACHCSG